ncbi:Elongator complex protein 4 [Blastocladiella britannica]|nr:Elongator complex protein 4 [Blastocladiella britannica]
MSAFRRAAPTTATTATTTVPTPTAAAPNITVTTPQRAALPPGLKLSAHNAAALLSTGVGSLDDLLGGGLPLGTLLVVAEQADAPHAALFLGYFIAQGLVHGHHVLVASADADPRAIAGTAPAPDVPSSTGSGSGRKRVGASAAAVAASSKSAKEDEDGDKLTIAWRYKNLPKRSESASDSPSAGAIATGPAAYCGQFDMTRPLSGAALPSGVSLASHILSCDLRHAAYPFEALYADIKRGIEQGGYLASAPPPTDGSPRPVLRIAIHNVHSVYWPSDDNTLPSYRHEAARFLHRLKSLLRRSYAAAVVTWSLPSPSSTSTTTATVTGTSGRLLPTSPVAAQADYAMTLAPFTRPIRSGASDTSAVTGLVHVSKLARVNALVPASVKITSGAVGVDRSLAFAVRRKRLVVEAWSLPPSLGDDPSGSGGGTACATSGGF